MIVLGLTGSMAMGKSTITRMLRLIYHVPVWDADQVVRDLLETDQDLIQEISKRYPHVMIQGKVDRSLLRLKAFEDQGCLETLENLIHERALSLCLQFLDKMKRLNISVCVLDVPLLFEVDWDRFCTHSVVVHAPSFIQKQRLRDRKYLTDKNINFLLSRQMSLSKKKARATYEILSGLSKGNTFRQLRRIMEDVKKG